MQDNLININENQVTTFRQKIGLSDTEAVNLKSLLLKLNVLTVYRPLSNPFSGMSLKSGSLRFMLINSNQPRSRQHFTIAHELYHLFIDNNPTPHCTPEHGKKSESEKCADAFALMFLMPAAGVRQMIPEEELLSENVSLATVLRLEHYFSVSRQATINRLSDLRLINRRQKEDLLSAPVVASAKAYGYSTTLYEPANHNLVIGNFGEKARKLFDEGKISEGHYLELLHKLGMDGSEN